MLPDPDGKRVGSGGATFNVLRYLAEQHPDEEHVFSEKRILVIHSGGNSKRVPQYSAEGKLFSPVPHELPDGRASTLFDEFMIAMSGVPSRMREGMLVLSGDVLLLFNPLQIDAQFCGVNAVVNEGADPEETVACLMNKDKKSELPKAIFPVHYSCARLMLANPHNLSDAAFLPSCKKFPV